jgi:glycosyltransferase involved in cell wall biosynthesis
VDSDARTRPGASVIMPVLNEERHLAEAVERVLAQRYDGPLEVVLALGPSSDRTDAIAAELAAQDARIRLVPNPSGRTPDGLNAAIGASAHPVVVRVDGHSVLPDDYVEVAVATLAETGADNVGGVMAAEGTTVFEQAVARAMTSRLGVGAAAFHTGGAAGPVDTVYLGVFRREALERVGGYDPRYTRTQDWEMNHRIRSTGGTIWFTPDLRVVYRPRPDVRRLARQYFEYGRWRRQVTRDHPGTLSARYLAAPLALAGVVGGLALTLLAVPGPDALALGAVAPAGYAALVVGGAVVTGVGLPLAARVRLPVVYATMHLSWGAGFLTSPRRLLERNVS